MAAEAFALAAKDHFHRHSLILGARADRINFGMFFFHSQSFYLIAMRG
jgi:hypothetical protein